MTWWINAAQYATEALAIVLIFRLLWLRERREHVYSVFIAFLLVQLAETVAYFACDRWGRGVVDYRIVWMCSTGIVAVFSLMLVYSLAKAVLAELPGIFRFSRNLLYIVFPLAILIAFSTARAEYGLTGGAASLDLVDRIMSFFGVADRGIAMASVLVLIAILGFILWFPVKMSKNLAIFSVGFVVYFASKTGLELVRTYSNPGSHSAVVLSTSGSLVLVLCFLYWIVFIDPKGQRAQVRIGHGWQVSEQHKLVEQLDALNVVLLRSSQRMPL